MLDEGFMKDAKIRKELLKLRFTALIRLIAMRNQQKDDFLQNAN